MKNQYLIILGGYHYYKEIEFLKGFSILTIVLMHFLQSPAMPETVNKFLSLGGTGVHIFFFTSGFGLYQSYSKKRIDYFEFIKHRF